METLLDIDVASYQSSDYLYKLNPIRFNFKFCKSMQTVRSKSNKKFNHQSNTPPKSLLSQYNLILLKTKSALKNINSHEYSQALFILNDVDRARNKEQFDRLYIQNGIIEVKVNTAYVLVFLADNRLEDIEKSVNKIINAIMCSYEGISQERSKQILYGISMKTLIGFDRIKDYVNYVQGHLNLNLEPLIALSISLLYQILNHPEISYQLSSACYQQIRQSADIVPRLLVCRHLLNLSKQINIQPRQVSYYTNQLTSLIKSRQIYGIAEQTLFRNYEKKLEYAKNLFNMLYQLQVEDLNKPIPQNNLIWLSRGISRKIRRHIEMHPEASNLNTLQKVLSLLQNTQNDSKISNTLQLLQSFQNKSKDSSLVESVRMQWNNKIQLFISNLSQIYCRKFMKNLMENWINHKNKQFVVDSSSLNIHNRSNGDIQIQHNKYLRKLQQLNQLNQNVPHGFQVRQQIERTSLSPQRKLNEQGKDSSLQFQPQNKYIAKIKHQSRILHLNEQSENNKSQRSFSRNSKSPTIGKKIEKVAVIAHQKVKPMKNNQSLISDREQGEQKHGSEVYKKYRRGIHSPIKSDFGSQIHNRSPHNRSTYLTKDLMRDEKSGTFDEKFTQNSFVNFKESQIVSKVMQKRITFSKQQSEEGSQGQQKQVNDVLAMMDKKSYEKVREEEREQNLQQRMQQRTEVRKQQKIISQFKGSPSKSEVLEQKKQRGNLIVSHKQQIIEQKGLRKEQKIQRYLQKRRKESQDPKVTKFMKFCQNGQFFIKRHFSSDGGQEKFVKLDNINRILKWASDQDKMKNSKFQSYKLGDIRGVVYGKVVETFLKDCNKKLQPWRCFSLILKKRTLDFYASEDVDLYIWLPGLTLALRQKNNQQIYSPGRVLWKRMLMKLQAQYVKPRQKGHKNHYKNANAHAIIMYGRAISDSKNASRRH